MPPDAIHVRRDDDDARRSATVRRVSARRRAEITADVTSGNGIRLPSSATAELVERHASRTGYLASPDEKRRARNAQP